MNSKPSLSGRARFSLLLQRFRDGIARTHQEMDQTRSDAAARREAQDAFYKELNARMAANNAQPADVTGATSLYTPDATGAPALYTADMTAPDSLADQPSAEVAQGGIPPLGAALFPDPIANAGVFRDPYAAVRRPRKVDVLGG